MVSRWEAEQRPRCDTMRGGGTKERVHALRQSLRVPVGRYDHGQRRRAPHRPVVRRAEVRPLAELKPHLPVFTQTAQWLDAYFEGTDPGFTPPISVKGSDFKKMVSSIMLSIPFGATSTYARIAAEVARRMGRKQMSAQAVGGAVGRNPIVLIVPCHRVLASDGSLRGYAGGVDRKEWLLEREGVNMPGLSTPPDADDGGERRE